MIIELYEYFDNPNIRVGAYHNKYENLKLDTVAKAILGTNKYDYEGSIVDLCSEELAFYNAKDTQLTYNLATHDNDFPVFILFFIMRFSTLGLAKANRKGITSWWSGFQYRNLHQLNTYHPNCSMLVQSSASDLKGGDVLDAILGVHEDVTILDFSSLYPTNIIKKAESIIPTYLP